MWNGYAWSRRTILTAKVLNTHTYIGASVRTHCVMWPTVDGEMDIEFRWKNNIGEPNMSSIANIYEPNIAKFRLLFMTSSPKNPVSWKRRGIIYEFHMLCGCDTHQNFTFLVESLLLPKERKSVCHGQAFLLLQYSTLFVYSVLILYAFN